MISRHEIEDRWRAGETLDQIATEYADGTPRKRPVSRQAISKRLIKAGYSPRERMYAEAAAAGSEASADRLEHLSRRADARAEASAELAALAAEYGLSVRALADVAGGKRDEPAAGLRARVVEACGDFSPEYLAHVTPSG
jgi:hypothetical protein